MVLRPHVRPFSKCAKMAKYGWEAAALPSVIMLHGPRACQDVSDSRSHSLSSASNLNRMSQNVIIVKIHEALSGFAIVVALLMLPRKQSVLDMLLHTVPQAEGTARKRSGPSLFDNDFEDFAPPPPRKFSSPMLNHSQRINAPSSTILSHAPKTSVHCLLAGAGSSCSMQLDEVAFPFVNHNSSCSS